MKKLLLTLFAAMNLASCATFKQGDAGNLVLAGALTGGLVGAGAGAAIGSIIANGSVVRSALLGTGIGVAAGVLLSGGGKNLALNSTINDQQDQIETNVSQIRRQEREIEKLRSEIDEQGKAIKLNASRKSRIYDGATIGSYYR